MGHFLAISFLAIPIDCIFSAHKTVQKSKKSHQKVFIKLICTEIGTVVTVSDLITSAKCRTKIFRGYGFTGAEFSIFLSILAWALHQCSANALPVIRCLFNFSVKHLPRGGYLRFQF